MNDVCKRTVPIHARKVTAVISTAILLFVPSNNGCLFSESITKFHRHLPHSYPACRATFTLPNCGVPCSRIVKGELLGTNYENRWILAFNFWPSISGIPAFWTTPCEATWAVAKKAQKKRDLNPWPPWYWCDALATNWAMKLCWNGEDHFHFHFLYAGHV